MLQVQRGPQSFLDILGVLLHPHAVASAALSERCVPIRRPRDVAGLQCSALQAQGLEKVEPGLRIRGEGFAWRPGSAPRAFLQGLQSRRPCDLGPYSLSPEAGVRSVLSRLVSPRVLSEVQLQGLEGCNRSAGHVCGAGFVGAQQVPGTRLSTLLLAWTPQGWGCTEKEAQAQGKVSCPGRELHTTSLPLGFQPRGLHRAAGEAEETSRSPAAQEPGRCPRRGADTGWGCFLTPPHICQAGS